MLSITYLTTGSKICTNLPRICTCSVSLSPSSVLSVRHNTFNMFYFPFCILCQSALKRRKLKIERARRPELGVVGLRVQAVPLPVLLPANDPGKQQMIAQVSGPLPRTWFLRSSHCTHLGSELTDGIWSPSVSPSLIITLTFKINK